MVHTTGGLLRPPKGMESVRATLLLCPGAISIHPTTPQGLSLLSIENEQVSLSPGP